MIDMDEHKVEQLNIPQASHSGKTDSVNPVKKEITKYVFARNRKKAAAGHYSHRKRLRSHITPPILPLPVKRSYTSSRKIHSRGGRLKLCGCYVVIPEDALTREVEITLEVKFMNWGQNIRNELMLFGPEIVLGPPGTTFRKPVVITITSCYHKIQECDHPPVKVETGQFWDLHEETTLGENGEFTFSVMHFSPYRFLLRLLGVEKSIVHMSFTRQIGDENEYEMIWCFCDNLREAKLEVQKEMAIQDFKLTKSTETFVIRCDENIRVSLEIADSPVQPGSKIISVNDLWFSDSVVKVEFTIGNLRARSRINYKIDMMKTGQDEVHSSKTNTFTFLPDTGNMDRGAQGGATVLHQPVIDTMLFP
ncbi:uncharacterized protein LOC120330201 [Styela clava]|uniref:uncharacterized protein LOC120330201 n=1 Tax=Styela clava TaxID=7725 RepID=UPI00193A0343|nr:uncharacterized protein LOC120330201 [Styela clava]